MQQLEEKRKLRRYLIRLRVIDRSTGELLGFAENIHMEGMKIMSKSPIPPNQELMVWLERTDAHPRIPVSIFRVWNSFLDSDPVIYCAGVHFINPSHEALDGIRTLMDAEENKSL